MDFKRPKMLVLPYMLIGGIAFVTGIEERQGFAVLCASILLFVGICAMMNGTPVVLTHREFLFKEGLFKTRKFSLPIEKIYGVKIVKYVSKSRGASFRSRYQYLFALSVEDCLQLMEQRKGTFSQALVEKKREYYQREYAYLYFPMNITWLKEAELAYLTKKLIAMNPAIQDLTYDTSPATSIGILKERRYEEVTESGKSKEKMELKYRILMFVCMVVFAVWEIYRRYFM